MPLSEEELRALEQMERALSAEDPKFASALQGTALRRSQRRRAILSGLALVGGVALLMTGVIIGVWAIGILGFLVMLAATTIGLTAIRGEQITLSLVGRSGSENDEKAARRGGIRQRWEGRRRRRRSGW